MKTVLLSQRVNSVFKNTSKSSKKLQRVLWLLPQLETDGEVEVNPHFFRSANTLVAQETEPGTPLSITEWTSSTRKLAIHFTLKMTRLQGGSWRGMQLISHGGFRSTEIIPGSRTLIVSTSRTMRLELRQANSSTTSNTRWRQVSGVSCTVVRRRSVGGREECRVRF